MNVVAIALPVALASAHMSGADVAMPRGTVIVTRVGHPFCAGRIDLHNYFREALGGDDVATPSTGEVCSLFRRQRRAVVVRALPSLGLVKVKVSIERGTATGWTTSAGVKVP